MSHVAIKDQPDQYGLLRAALALFKKTPSELSDEEIDVVRRQAKTEYDIENRVLNSPEALGVVVPEQTVDQSVQAIQNRFQDETIFINELERNGLDFQSLKQSIARQCKVESILETVASRASTVSDVEVGIYYHMHPEKFQIPERRGVSHILITVNEQFPENTHSKALKRMTMIAEKLAHKPHKFADLALKHSECPTAMQGGRLGLFPRGQLYASIDAVLFSLKTGDISDIIETEAGFHLIRCDEIRHAETLSFKKAQAKIRHLLQEHTRRTCQRAWIASLSASKHNVNH